MPTHTIPVRKIVDVANLSPGFRASVIADGATLPAQAPSTIETGMAEICRFAGSCDATTPARPAVVAAAATPGRRERHIASIGADGV